MRPCPLCGRNVRVYGANELHTSQRPLVVACEKAGPCSYTIGRFVTLDEAMATHDRIAAAIMAEMGGTIIEIKKGGTFK